MFATSSFIGAEKWAQVVFIRLRMSMHRIGAGSLSSNVRWSCSSLNLGSTSNPSIWKRLPFFARSHNINPGLLSVHNRRFSEQAVDSHVHKNVIDDVGPVRLQLHRSCLVVQHPRWPVDDVFLSLVWLRDHCRCSSCYNHATCQRQTDVRDLVFDVHPLEFGVDSTGTTVNIVWHDGHRSEYSLQWLWENSHVSRRYRRLQQDRIWTRCLWDGRSAAREGMTAVDHDQFMDSEAGVRHVMKGFLTHGVAMVTGVPPTVEATQRVIERVGVVQSTLYGAMWQFTADGSHADTAYTQQALATHTDGTYCSQPPGVQVFHCLGHDGSGGETTLVDGFSGLQRLYDSDPAAYRALSSLPCAGEYRDPARGVHQVCGEPVVAHRDGGDDDPRPERLLRLRFNPYDRAPARGLSPAELDAFYRAYQRLAAVLWSPRLEWRTKLAPGTVLFIDNWRVLHGRAAFTGRRVMCGGYVARTDVMSTARVCGLLL